MINKITKEQEAEIPIFIDRFVKKASSPIERTGLKELTKKMWGEEKLVIVGESLQNTIDLIRFATKGEKIEYGDSQLSNQLYNQLDNQLRDQLGNQLYNQLDNQLYNQLHNQLYKQLGSQKITYNYYVSLWWLAWLGFYSYAKHIGVIFDEEKLSTFSKILDTFSINIFIGNVVFVCERPTVLWDNGLLSNDQKPAISWKDNTGYYYLDGVHFEKEMWKRVVSKEMTFSEIMKVEISDQRTVALKYNPQAIIKEKAKLIHKSERGNELYLVEGSEINTLTNFPEMYFLKMTCPTGRVFVEGVPPEEAKKNPNADDMQAYLCGLTKSEYMSMSMES